MKFNSVEYYISTVIGGDPVTLTEVKQHLGMSFETSGSYDFTDDDNYINGLIGYAVSKVERFIGQSIRGNTVTATIRNECGDVSLPMCPFGVLSTATDADGNDISANVELSGGKFPTLLSPLYDEVNLVYTAGWYVLGTNSYGKLPGEIKQAIIEEVAWRYHNRGTENTGLSVQAKELLVPYIKKSFLV